MAEAFALREDLQGTIQSNDDDGNPVDVEKFRGASFALRNGETFDVAEHLEHGGGVIVTDDTELAAQLTSASYLKSVAVPDDPAMVTPLTSMTVSALRDLPEANAVEGAGRMRKDELAFRVTLARNGLDPNVPVREREDGTFVVDETDTDQDDDNGGGS